jgi:hypothetical protein
MLFTIFLALLSLVISAVGEVNKIIYNGERTNPTSLNTYEDTWKTYESLDNYKRKFYA